jgi:hypothetical protein
MIRNLTLGTMAITIITLNLTSITFAANQPNTAKPTTVVTVKGIHSELDLLKQTFQSGPLNVEFRYVKGTLQYLRILNTANYPIQVHLLETFYTLGPSDYVILSPPRLPYLMFSYEPYYGLRTFVTRIFPEKFGKVHYYTLPPKR